MTPVHTPSGCSFLVGTIDRVASAGEESDIDSTVFASMPWPVAHDGEDSLVYSRRVFGVFGTGGAGGAGDAGDASSTTMESVGGEGRGKPSHSDTLLTVY